MGERSQSMATSSFGCSGSTATASLTPGAMDASFASGTRWPNMAWKGAWPASVTSRVNSQIGSLSLSASADGSMSRIQLLKRIAIGRQHLGCVACGLRRRSAAYGTQQGGDLGAGGLPSGVEGEWQAAHLHDAGPCLSPELSRGRRAGTGQGRVDLVPVRNDVRRVGRIDQHFGDRAVAFGVEGGRVFSGAAS